MMFITNCINNLENEKRIFGRIIEKVIKYVCSNNKKEKFTDEDIEGLKLLLSSQILKY